MYLNKLSSNKYTVLLEYSEIRESLLRESNVSADSLDTISSLAFQDQYGIPLQTAIQLDADKQWQRWKAKHENSSQTVYSTQIKALKTEGKGRFVEFDLITSDIDQSGSAHDQSFDDLITPQAISNVETQLKGSLVNMIDPVKVRDFQEVIDGAKYGGIGHEHIYTDQDIVPALIIDQVKAIDNNTKLRVTAKINDLSQRANDVWGMIQNKTLKGASIEYKVLKQHYQNMGDKVVRVIDDLVLSGFTLTSKMRNQNCGITGWFVKALEPSLSSTSSGTQDNITMVEEEKVIPEEPVEPPVEPKEEPTEATQEVVETPKEAEEVDQVKALQEELASLKEELDQVKALDADKKLIDELKPILAEQVKAALEAEQKQLVEEDQAKFEQVKAAKEEILAAKAQGIDAMWSVAAAKHNELGI